MFNQHSLAFPDMSKFERHLCEWYIVTWKRKLYWTLNTKINLILFLQRFKALRYVAIVKTHQYNNQLLLQVWFMGMLFETLVKKSWINNCTLKKKLLSSYPFFIFLPFPIKIKILIENMSFKTRKMTLKMSNNIFQI